MFKDKLKLIKKDFENHKEDRELFFARCVSDRLEKGLQSYNDYLDSTIEYLASKNPTTVIRRI